MLWIGLDITNTRVVDWTRYQLQTHVLLKGRKVGHVLFIDALNSLLFTVIWRHDSISTNFSPEIS